MPLRLITGTDNVPRSNLGICTCEFAGKEYIFKMNVNKTTIFIFITCPFFFKTKTSPIENLLIETQRFKSIGDRTIKK
jgi:hypothetical protein